MNRKTRTLIFLGLKLFRTTKYRIDKLKKFKLGAPKQLRQEPL